MTRGVSWWMVLLAVGCGRVGFDLRGGDAVADDAPGPLGPFGAPTRIVELSSPGREDDPTLTADLLEIYFESDRPGGAGSSDLWASVRADLASPWSVPVNVAVLNSAAEDEHPGISADGLTLWFSSTRSGMQDLYVTTRATRADAWGAPVPVSELNGEYVEGGPQPDDSGLALVLAITMPATLEDIYLSTRASVDEPWSPPTSLGPGVNLPGEEDESPMLAADHLALYFSSKRNGPADLFVATRATTGEPFEPAQPISELNTSGDEGDPWISPDQRTLVFAANAQQGRELFLATR